ncbi:MAG: hypothetical protein SFX72_07630 [Isosphaeraceae bacterium]|nr:hypothetical protein [Isosphaeraceae bacterium]
MSDPRLRSAAILLILAAGSIAGCATVGDRTSPPLVPTRYQTRTGPFVVFTNDPLPADSAVIKQLHALEREFSETLDVTLGAAEPPIEIYLLTDRKTFEHFLTFYYPELPQRRAFFLGQGERRVIYTHVSDKLEIDVRHEATHALASIAVGDLPLWLDEGLAEYFECPGADGGNPDDLRKLRAALAESWTPDLARLESVATVKEMTPLDYHEAWAWVHLALDGDAERTRFRAWLASRAAAPDDARPFASIFGEVSPADLSDRLRSHVANLSEQSPSRTPADIAAVRPARAPIVRLQEASADVLPRTARPKPLKGFFARMRDFVLGDDSTN